MAEFVGYSCDRCPTMRVGWSDGRAPTAGLLALTCLNCGRDAEVPPGDTPPCPACGRAELRPTYDLLGEPCWNCPAGVFRLDPTVGEEG